MSSDDPTKELLNGNPPKTPNEIDFEVFAHDVNQGLRGMAEQIRDLDIKIDAKLRTTSPNLDNTLKEIANTRVEMRERFEKLERMFDLQIGELSHEVIRLRAENRDFHDRFERLEQRPL